MKLPYNLNDIHIQPNEFGDSDIFNTSLKRLDDNLQYIKNNIQNDKMIILSGPGRTGKSTLERDIRTYLGNENCGDFSMTCDFIYNETILI